MKKRYKVTKLKGMYILYRYEDVKVANWFFSFRLTRIEKQWVALYQSEDLENVKSEIYKQKRLDLVKDDPKYDKEMLIFEA